MAGRHPAATARVARDIQLTLFGEPEPAEAPPAVDALAIEHEEAARLAADIPAGIFFGTSSWSFPGWKGLVYSSSASTATLARDGLLEYARHPLLRTVGLDRSYYAPIPESDLQRYADQLPEGFPCCAKAPSAVTSAEPDFLSVDRFLFEILEPFARSFASHTGPFILQFAPGAARAVQSPQHFAHALDAFLGRLPTEFQYAVELRDRALFTPEYRQVLASHGAAHVYNFWSHVPLPARQATFLPPEDQPFSVVRLLMRPGATYEEQREAFRPFNRIVEPSETVRAQVADIARRVVNRGRRVFVLVNNKAEGSAPLTIKAIAARLAAERQKDAT